MSEKMINARFHPNYRHTPRVLSDVGSKMEIVYKPVIDENGKVELIEDTKVNFYEMIQSHKDSTDLHSMIARYEHGDINALNRKAGIFADLTTAPKNLADFYNKLTDATNVFHQLPVEIQNSFNNNAFEFWTKLETSEGVQVLVDYNAKVNASKKIDLSVIDNNKEVASNEL